MALPSLLKELKQRGYHIVQVVPPGARPKSVPVLAEPAAIAKREGWPRLAKTHRGVSTHAIMAVRHRAKAVSVRKHHHAVRLRQRAKALSARKHRQHLRRWASKRI